MGKIKLLKARFLEIEESFENGEDDHQLVYDFEDKLEDAFYEIYRDKQADQLNKLKKQVQAFKREHEFYDAEAELDRMFPDRYDEDFDEDSMSWDSVFGDD